MNMAKFTRQEVIAKVNAGESLYKADLSEADLYGAILTGAFLSWANLRAADLWGARLSGANLSGADLSWAKYDADTTWPEGVDPVARAALMVA